MYDNRPHGQIGRNYVKSLLVGGLMVANGLFVLWVPAEWSTLASYGVGAINGFVLGRVWGT